MDYTNEEWIHFGTTKTGGQTVKHHRERYWYISDHGRVKVTNNYNDEIRWPSISLTGGHPGSRYAAISKNDLQSKYVHRLVAMNFCHNPFGELSRKITVDHLDGNKMNNHYTNLEWVTNKENNFRARTRRLLGDMTPTSQEITRTWTRQDTDEIIIDLYSKGLSTSQIQRRLGLTQSRVWRPVNKYRKANGITGKNYETNQSSLV